MVPMWVILAAGHCLDIARLGFSDCCFSPPGCALKPSAEGISVHPPSLAWDEVGGGGRETWPSAASWRCLGLGSPEISRSVILITDTLLRDFTWSTICLQSAQTLSWGPNIAASLPPLAPIAPTGKEVGPAEEGLQGVQGVTRVE